MKLDELIDKLEKIKESEGNLEVQCCGEMCGDGNYQIEIVCIEDELDDNLNETGTKYCQLWMEYLPRGYKIK